MVAVGGEQCGVVTSLLKYRVGWVLRHSGEQNNESSG